MRSIRPISISRTTDSTAEIVELYEAKRHLNIVDCTDDDEYIASLIVSARHTIEESTSRALASAQSWVAGYECFNWRGFLHIPRPPLVSVDAVKYFDCNNVEQTISSSKYIVDGSGDGAAQLGFTDDFSYTSLSKDYRAPFRVEFTAGYTAGNFPRNLKRAMFYLIEHFYENRTPVSVAASVAEVPLTFKYLLNQKRIHNGF